MQLRHILRAILSHCDTVVGLGTNVVGQDDTSLLQNEQSSIEVDSKAMQSEQCSSQPLSTFDGALSPFVDGVVEYIAGFVVKKFLQQELCSLCRESLVSQKGMQTQEFPAMCASLLLIKDLGGLHQPSHCVINVIKEL